MHQCAWAPRPDRASRYCRDAELLRTVRVAVHNARVVLVYVRRSCMLAGSNSVYEVTMPKLDRTAHSESVMEVCHAVVLDAALT